MRWNCIVPTFSRCTSRNRSMNRVRLVHMSGSRKRSIDHMSIGLFEIGVPVSATRLSQFSASFQHILAVLDLGFLIRCASSRIIRSQNWFRGPSVLSLFDSLVVP